MFRFTLHCNLYYHCIFFSWQFSLDYANEEIDYKYDPVRVATVNRTTSTQTQLSALFALFHTLNWKKFVVVTDGVHESHRLVNLLQESLGPWNLEMIDWLLYTPDVSFDEMYFSFEHLGKNARAILLITNSLKMANKIFKAKESISRSKWIFVSDLDLTTFTNTSFPETIYTLTPTLIQEITLSGYVDDAVRSISLALARRRNPEVGTCPKMDEMRR